MPSRQYLPLVAIAALLATRVPAWCAPEGDTERRRPHIVLVMSDDQGWGDVGFNGHPVLQTPHLDAAAAAGLRLDSFYAAAPSCSPTRASVLTGRHPNRMGIFSWGYPLRPQEVTIAEVLKREGYVTGHFGKWHLGSVRADSPVNPGRHGFDRWISSANFFDNDPRLSDQGRETRFRGESSEVVADMAVDWIREASGSGAPIFAVIWFGSPHLPHRADAEETALYTDQPRRMREFLGEVTGIDRAFGKIRDGLEEAGLRDNTLLWFTSDNGALRKVGSTGGYRGGKHSVFEGGLRVPALIEWPAAIPEPRVTSVRCSTVDIFPTILEVTGASAEGLPVLDGVSLVPAIEGRMSQRDHPLGFWNANIPGRFTDPGGFVTKVLPKPDRWTQGRIERVTRRVEKVPKRPFPEGVFGGHAAWISGDWKLHRFSMTEGQKVKWELYNLETDPGERSDVSDEYPEIVGEMGEDLERWLGGVVSSLEGEDYR